MKRIPTSRAAYAALLAQLSNPDISVRELERVIKQDVSLTHRVLRAVNSAATPLRVEIRSIDQAIILLGRDTIRRWGALWAIASINKAACPELINSSIIRARCCELLDAGAGRESGAGFLLGICSLLDAILEQPMETVLQQLPVQADLRAALLGETNGRRTLLDCVIAYERGDWQSSEALASEAGVNAAVLPGAYQEALGWARAISSAPSIARGQASTIDIRYTARMQARLFLVLLVSALAHDPRLARDRSAAKGRLRSAPTPSWACRARRRCCARRSSCPAATRRSSRRNSGFWFMPDD